MTNFDISKLYQNYISNSSDIIFLSSDDFQATDYNKRTKKALNCSHDWKLYTFRFLLHHCCFSWADAKEKSDVTNYYIDFWCWLIFQLFCVFCIYKCVCYFNVVRGKTPKYALLTFSNIVVLKMVMENITVVNTGVTKRKECGLLLTRHGNSMKPGFL